MESCTQVEQNAPKQSLLEVSSAGDSKESKRGGKRAGAGRPPNIAKRLLKGFSREALTEAASTIDCGAVLVGLLRSKKERTRMEALVFLRDTIIGRPAQDVRHSGGVLHAHTGWAPLAFGALSEEEAQQLDAITKKLTAPPVSNASQNARQNQIESKPALEAEVMASDTIEA